MKFRPLSRWGSSGRVRVLKDRVMVGLAQGNWMFRSLRLRSVAEPVKIVWAVSPPPAKLARSVTRGASRSISPRHLFQVLRRSLRLPLRSVAVRSIW